MIEICVIIFMFTFYLNAVFISQVDEKKSDKESIEKNDAEQVT